MMAANIMAQYVENYLDLIENSPNEIIRQITRLHEKNHLYSKLSNKLEEMMKILVEKESGLDNGKNKDLINEKEDLEEDKEATKKTKALISVKRYLLEIQEIADEKLSIVQSILDHLDYKNKQLDFDHRNISIQNSSSLSKNIHSTLSLNSIDDENLSSISNNENLNNENNFSKDSTNISTSQSNSLNNHHSSNSKRSSSRRNLNTSKSESHNSNEINNSSFNLGNNNNSNNGNNTLNHSLTGKRGVKRGVKGGNKDMKRSKNSSGKDLSGNSPSGLYEDTPIDPDEPTYCSCEQVSFGEMICCDNSACLIEWFHFSCVSLTTKPKGKWYCPNCRGDRSNIPKK